VRQHYIGDRFDVGHLLDNHAPHAIGDPRSDIPDEPGNPVTVAVGGPVAAPEAAASAESNPTVTTVPTVSSNEVDVPNPAPPAPALPPVPQPDHDPILGTSVTVLGELVFEQLEVDAAASMPPPMLDDGDEDWPVKPPWQSDH
jgi:hypothetical protein